MGPESIASVPLDPYREIDTFCLITFLAAFVFVCIANTKAAKNVIRQNRAQRGLGS
ncbi:hypothetical protein FACS1894133_1060 [Clostridia bacterium]|nr:hypothetical protein FACS1894133_1060 [Clostridia bacterium]